MGMGPISEKYGILYYFCFGTCFTFFFVACPVGYYFVDLFYPFWTNDYYEYGKSDHFNNYEKTCYRDETTALTFEAAEANCIGDNGYLVEPQNEKYLQIISRTTKIRYDFSVPQFWLGIKKVNEQ